MQTKAVSPIASAGGASSLPVPARRVLMLSSAVAVAVGTLALTSGKPAAIDPDLVRVLRFMAAMKGIFALLALAAGYWRLARPANLWRTTVYVMGPPLMIVGASGMWALQHAGLSALSLHAGLFAVIAAAVTDRDFLPAIPASRVRRR